MSQKEIQCVDVKKFSLLVKEGDSRLCSIHIKGSKDGLQVFIKCGANEYQLYTQRGKPRLFRSPATAVNFIAELGADRLVLEDLSKWNPASYVNQNSRRKTKPGDQNLQQKTGARNVRQS